VSGAFGAGTERTASLGLSAPADEETRMTTTRRLGLAAALMMLSGNALARNAFDGQICSLGTSGVGKAGAVICARRRR